MISKRCIDLSYQLRVRRSRLCMVGSRAAGQHAQAALLSCICWSAGHDPARIPQIQDPPIKAVQRVPTPWCLLTFDLSTA